MSTELTASEIIAKDTIARYLRQSNMPELHAKKTVQLQPGLFCDCLSSLQQKRGKGFIHALVGPRGVGKTQLACELIRSYCNAQRTAYYTTAISFFIKARESMKKDSEESLSDFMERITKKRLLVIEEASRRSQTEFENNLLFEIVNGRYNAMVDTLLIDNCTPEGFNQSMDPSIISRMNETGGIISCDGWTNHRQ